jgi:threonine dehydratase
VTLASSGSFGMACAAAAHELGLRATVFMPANTPASKQRKITELGGRVDAHWKTYEDAKAEARRAGEEPGSRFLDGVGAGVYRGNASLARAVVADGRLVRKGAAIVVPLGIGSLAVPTALYLSGAGYDFDLVVVEPLTHAKSVAALGGDVAPDGADTLADGAAVAVVPPDSAAILDAVTSAAIAVSEPEISSAIRHLWSESGVRAEGAGALATAAVLAAPEHFDGYAQVWTFVTGRNIDDDRFGEIVS